MADPIYYNSSLEGDQIEELLVGLFNASGLIKANGFGSISSAQAGIDYSLPILIRTSNPNSSTRGSIGQLCVNIQSVPPSIFVCKEIVDSTYTWSKIGEQSTFLKAIYGTTTFSEVASAYSSGKFIYLQKEDELVLHFAVYSKFDNTTNSYIFYEITSTGVIVYVLKQTGWTQLETKFQDISTIVTTREPISSTSGDIGSLKVFDKKLYVCTSINGTIYTWTKIGGNEYQFLDPIEDGHLTISLME